MLVNTKFKFITTYQFCFVISQGGISGTTLALYMGTNVSTARLFLGNLRKVHQLGNEEIWVKNAAQLDGILVESSDN